MAYRKDWISLIRTLAPRYGVDPRAALAVASAEGLGGGIGDQGTSFGPFQLHVGGALPHGRNRAWAESPAGIEYALRQIGGVARGLSGPAAVQAIVSRFERPANPQGEIQRAIGALGQFGGGAAGAPSAGVTPSPPAAAAAPEPLDMRRQLAMMLAAGKPIDWLGLAAQRTQGPQPAAQPAAIPARQPTQYPQMTQGGKDPFPNLAFASHTDWRHVDLSLLNRLQQLAAQRGVTLNVFSGYRSPGYSASVGGYSTDPHTRGVAVDVNLGATPVGDVAGWYKALTAAGLQSGATPGFYRGRTDPSHIQIPGAGVNKRTRARRTYGR